MLLEILINTHTHVCVCVYLYVCLCVILVLFNILRDYTARIFPDKIPHVPSEPDSSYFISNDGMKICESKQA